MKNLKRLREDHGLSQQKFAEIFNLSQQSVYKYENNLSEPSLDTLKKIADYYETSMDYLTDYTDTPIPPDYENTCTATITCDEMHLITQFRNLSSDYKSLILELISCHLKELNIENKEK